MIEDRAEVLLHDSDRTRVTRVRLDDGISVVRKQPLGAGAAARLSNELAVLRRLESVGGTPRLAPESLDGILSLRDDSGRTIAEEVWATGALLDLAADLAGILAGVHRSGVVHRDVSPANVLVDPETGRPTLIDFELAVLDSRDAGTVPGLAGTLPYLAPEQTGRTGRPVDHRSDLYSLGATLYELATGQPPFGRDRDPLSLVHDHLARVPVAPSEVNPRVPALLSEIILRLLSKEPEQRYQSGEGLAHDLTLLREGRLTVLGERDFPMRLAPPARLIGREAPLAALHRLLAGTSGGRSAFALVTGPPGVGKTALVDRLRPAVAEAGGRFVTGKFDQFHHDLGGGAVREAFDQLADRLQAEPEDVVAGLRERLRAALGADCGLIAAAMPAFRALLDVEPERSTEDPRAFFARLRKAGLALLRAVAGTGPLVMFLDDLQWASRSAFSFLDDVLDNPDVPGLLVLGAYREEEVDEAHPLTAVLARLHRERGDAGEVRLDNLSGGDLGVLIAGMLRLPEAGRLAEVLAERTRGNPFDTVELLNALRREGVLVPDGGGWRWDAASVRDFVGHGDVVALIGARIDALPDGTREAVDLMACLGGEVPLELLGAPLTAAVDDGLVTVGDGTARFRHDRVQQAAYGRLDTTRRARLSLSLARDLAPAPEAAPLYLAAIDELLVPGTAGPGETEAAAKLLRRSATAARRVANHATAEVHLAGALRLLDQTHEMYATLRAEWHAALCALSRFDEADRVFAELNTPAHDPVWRSGPVAEHLGTLTNRRMLGEALSLGLDLLAELGIDVPADPEAMAPRIGAALAAFHGWLATGGDSADRPEMTDPRLLAAAHVINRLTGAAFFADRMRMAWLVAQASELWTEHGVCAALTGVLGNIGMVTLGGGGDPRAAYRAVTHVLATGESRGYEPETSQVRFLHVVATQPWFEPLENGIRLAHEARDGLLRGGDLRNALYTYHASVPHMLDSIPDLESFRREAQAAVAFGERIGAGDDAAMFESYLRLVRALRGETAGGSFGDDEDEHLAGLAGSPAAASVFTNLRSLSAVIFQDDETLVRTSAESMRVVTQMPEAYTLAGAHVFAALAAAVTAREATGRRRAEALAALDRSHDFLATRAGWQPGNFRHLYRLVEATRAAVNGEFAAAAAAYDAAMSDAETAGRAWHFPLITELAARFYLDHGLEHVGARLLSEALPGYARWGATGKVHALKRSYPALGSALGGTATTRPATVGGSHSINLSTEVIDLMAVLEAARALSSETDVDRLRVRVQQVLGAMTGATAVHVVLRDDRDTRWVLPADGDRPELDVEEAARQGLLPLSAIRYAERTREPLLVDDVSLDDRVGRDPYLAGLDHCSLLVAPVIAHGEPRAVLVLENRLSRRAFSAGRLDGVLLIAGQLTVSLENAQIYASLERAVAERTEELARANHRLELLTVTDPLTGLPNRRKLAAFLDDTWMRSQRSGEPIGVAMIDIDHFKKYNDHYGHQGGDECLRQVADALVASVRNTDLVARYGGEEFCIVMPGAAAENAIVVAERACRAVARLAQPHALAGGGIVTVSVGVTSGTPLTHPGGPDQLQKLADEALYEAKRTGRNRVVGG
ncbi:serine/threonine protein kinase [Actinoplanes italicus]|uniref:diguanylate cyclase n=1 Tax=Actinoplanes italicus TaxID=113567 RepID=UPI00147300B1|nr:diguanylate cyclase [Actinoplanes italicus]GIE32394.1 serine/threonine protein kinase [Actinoplanes italicus]